MNDADCNGFCLRIWTCSSRFFCSESILSVKIFFSFFFLNAISDLKYRRGYISPTTTDKVRKIREHGGTFESSYVQVLTPFGLYGRKGGCKEFLTRGTTISR